MNEPLRTPAVARIAASNLARAATVAPAGHGAPAHSRDRPELAGE
jgi:hypothetical protein